MFLLSSWFIECLCLSLCAHSFTEKVLVGQSDDVFGGLHSLQGGRQKQIVKNIDRALVRLLLASSLTLRWNDVGVGLGELALAEHPRDRVSKFHKMRLASDDDDDDVYPVVSERSIDTKFRFGRRALMTNLLVASGTELFVSASVSAATSKTSEKFNAASLAFQQGNYLESERLWRNVASETDDPVAWSNLAIVLIINASEDPAMELGKLPAGKARERLEEALAAIDRSESVGSQPDALNLNAKGNAFGLLLRWDDASAAYEASAAAAPKDFVSIPLGNEALALFELQKLPEVEGITLRLLQTDPNFVDARAVRAILRYDQGDIGGAAAEMAKLCTKSEVGENFCNIYSSIDAVLGRWSPRAVATYRKLLTESSIQRELRNRI